MTCQPVYPEYVEMVLDQWEWLAFTAYEWFEKMGRLVVGIEEVPGAAGPQLLAVIYDYENGKPDDTTAKLLATYDPEYEIIMQFKDLSGQIRTQRLRTAPGRRHPKRVFFFEMLRRVHKEPESSESGDLPKWFIQALEKLEAMNKDKQEDSE